MSGGGIKCVAVARSLIRDGTCCAYFHFWSSRERDESWCRRKNANAQRARHLKAIQITRRPLGVFFQFSMEDEGADRGREPHTVQSCVPRRCASLPFVRRCATLMVSWPTHLTLAVLMVALKPASSSRPPIQCLNRWLSGQCRAYNVVKIQSWRIRVYGARKRVP
jgi:hypothetical protein